LRIGGAGAPATVKTLNNLLPSGMEVVIPDYEGPDALFAIGDQQGRIVLDGIRAAEATRAGGMNGHTRVVTWGYSGGGLATAWSAELQPSYAASVNLVGAAEGGVPADLKSSLAVLDGGMYAFLAVMTLVAIDHAYPGIGLERLLTAAGKSVISHFGATCGNPAVQTQFQGTRLDSLAAVPSLLNAPALQPVFADLKLGKHPPATAIYNYQGTADDVVGYTPDRDLVSYYCANNVTVDFVPIQGANHYQAFLDGVSGVATWILDRMDGKRATTNCGS
jgi:triacylglycerol lipase